MREYVSFTTVALQSCDFSARFPEYVSFILRLYYKRYLKNLTSRFRGPQIIRIVLLAGCFFYFIGGGGTLISGEGIKQTSRDEGRMEEWLEVIALPRLPTFSYFPANLGAAKSVPQQQGSRVYLEVG